MTSRCIRVAVPLLALILVASLSLVSADANHQADHRRIDVAEALLHGEAQAAVPNALFERVAAFWRGDDDNINADAAKTSANHKESTTAALSRLASDLFLISQRDAPINYCEYDFAVTPHIAEFWNTISNIAFVIVGIEGIIISARAGLRPRFYYLASLVLATGFCSALYHATLTSDTRTHRRGILRENAPLSRSVSVRTAAFPRRRCKRTLAHEEQMGRMRMEMVDMQGVTHLTLCLSVSCVSLSWLGLKLDETLENLACAMLIYLGDRTIVIALVHHFFATLGIFFVTAFLFTEVHLVTCMLATLRHLHVRTAEKMRYHLYRGGAFLSAYTRTYQRGQR